MNTFDDSTGVFHNEDSKTDFTIAVIDDRPGFEMFQITACSGGNQALYPQTPCDGDELLRWLGRFFGNKDEGRFIHIIERIKMDRRQDEGSEAQHGSFL
jgi:hypothetical protein